MVGVDPASEGLKRAANDGLQTTVRRRRRRCSAQAELPDLVFEATSAYVHRENAPRYEAGRHPRDRPHAGRDRPVRRPAGQPARAPRRAERQPDHLRRPGDDPDGLRRLAHRPGRLRRDRRDRGVDVGRAGHARQHRRVHPHDEPRRRGHRRRQARQGDHRAQPGRPADDHARHDLLRDPGRRRQRRDRRVDP